MRVIAFADEQPPVDAADLVASNQPDAVVTLGDLQPDWTPRWQGSTCPASACTATTTASTSWRRPAFATCICRERGR